MATNHTEHYGLSLWEAQDKFYHQEFNENHRKLDAALHGLAENKTEAAFSTAMRADVDHLMSTQAAIVTGTYVGSGQCGAAHPNTLDFTGVLDRPPKLVLVRPQEANNLFLLVIRGMTSAMSCSDLNSYSEPFCFLSWSETALSWYASNEQQQLNQSGKAYYYIAIG